LQAKLFSKSGSNDGRQALKQVFGEEISEVERFVEVCAQRLNFGGYEEEVRNLYWRLDVDRTGKVDAELFASILFNEPSSRAKTTIGKCSTISLLSHK